MVTSINFVVFTPMGHAWVMYNGSWVNFVVGHWVMVTSSDSLPALHHSIATTRDSRYRTRPNRPMALFACSMTA